MAKKKSTVSDERETDSLAEIDFESALAEVQKVVQQLESGELGLTESLAQYERGIKKIKLCHQVLRHAEKRIAVLTGVDEDGTALIEPVDTSGGQSPSIAKSSRGGDRPRAKKSRPPISDVDDSAGLF
ncbi:MAG: exodeoxyribonuclease VII small subunit [Planctomycetales bacterium]|nr:exodeoxyribonuclease VII small subunit [Planctomycetales bacterium]